MDEQYDITVSGPHDIKFTVRVSRELAATIGALLIKGEGGAKGGTPIKMESSFTGGTRQSVAEYVHAKNPKRNPDKILAIAGYLAENGDENFSPEDIKPYFQKIGEPVPANFGRDFRWAVANAWIAESLDGKNLFYVTTTGKSVISANFAAESIGRTKQKIRLKAAKKRGANSDGNI